MLAYTLRRTLWAIPTVLAVITVCYLLLHLTPGGPFDTEKQLSAAVLQNLNAKYHLNEPLWRQYLLYLDALLHGDLGPSFRYSDWSVNDLVWKALPVSLGVGGVSVPIAMALGVAFGTVAAVRRGSFVDHGVMVLGNIGNVVPPFVLGPVLVWIFAILLRTADGHGWLPAGGWGDGKWQYRVLPVALLTLINMATIARVMRGSMIEVLGRQLHSNRARKGIAWPHDRVAACAEAGADAGGVAARLGVHLVDHLRGRDRIGVRAAGARAARRERRDQSRLHARARSRRADDGGGCSVQPARRPRVCVARPAHPLLTP